MHDDLRVIGIRVHTYSLLRARNGGPDTKILGIPTGTPHARADDILVLAFPISPMISRMSDAELSKMQARTHTAPTPASLCVRGRVEEGVAACARPWTRL